MPAYCNRLLPTDAWVRFILAPALVFIALAGDHQYLADFWHHLARGRAIVETGRLLDHDVFTFTVPGQPFQDVNWLSQVIYFKLYQFRGLALVQISNALCVAATIFLLVAVCRRRAQSLIVAMAVGIAAFLGLWQVLTIRPQTFSLLLFVLLYDVLDRSLQRQWLLLFAPPIVALWANLHGAFPAGLILVGGFFLNAGWEAWRSRLFAGLGGKAACLVGCILATLLNPYGWNIYAYVGGTSARAAARRIDEWVPPGLDQWIGLAFFASLVLFMVLVALTWRRRRLESRDVILLALFLPLALTSVRMVAWWLLLLAPAAATLLAELLPRANDTMVDVKPSRGAGFTLLALLALVVSSVPGLQSYNPLLANRAPKRTESDLDAIHARIRTAMPGGRLFARLEWGEYLGWIGSPNYLVFMDGRIEIYPDAVWEEYSTITLGKPGWQQILERYGVDALILDASYHARTGLLPEVDNCLRWQRVVELRGAILFLRK